MIEAVVRQESILGPAWEPDAEFDSPSMSCLARSIGPSPPHCSILRMVCDHWYAAVVRPVTVSTVIVQERDGPPGPLAVKMIVGVPLGLCTDPSGVNRSVCPEMLLVDRATFLLMRARP